MLRRRLRRFWPLLLGAVLCLAVWGEWSSARSQGPANNANANHQQDSSAVNNDFAGVTLVTWARDNHDAIEALSAIGSVIFALVLTISTVGLWIVTRGGADSTKNAAKAAEKSAHVAERALTELERPWVFIYGVYELIADPITSDRQRPYCNYTVANHGRFPAIIQNVLVAFSTGETAPDAPIRADGSHPLFVTPILGNNDSHGCVEELPAGIQHRTYYPPEDAGESQGGAIPELGTNEELFLWIQILYEGPTTKNHVTSACWRWHAGEGHFVPFGAEKYNYNR